VATQLITIPGGTHGPTFLPESNRRDAVASSRPAGWPDYFGETVRWFDNYLKGKAAAD
jgi:hypothetical protein